MRSLDSLGAGRLEIDLPSPVRSLVRCLVCGFAELRTDEVAHRGLLLLAECPRCEHRWTRDAGPVEPPPVPPAPSVRRVPPPRSDEESVAAA